MGGKKDELKEQAAEAVEDLKAKAQEVGDKVSGDEEPEKKGGKLKVFATLAAAVGGALFFFKKKREQELDEALWEEPRSL